MQNKTKIYLVSLAIFGFSFLLTGEVKANSCEDGGYQCKANDCGSYGMEVVTPTNAFKCGTGDNYDGRVCCKPGSTTQPTTTQPTTTQPTTTQPASGSGWSSNNLRMFNLPEAPVYYIITNILNWLLTIVGVLAIIALVFSGLQYFLVATDEKMLETAKKTMRAAVIGLIVAISGMVVIFAVESMLRAQMFF